MAKIIKRTKEERATVSVRTMDEKRPAMPYKWWQGGNASDRSSQLLSTVGFLKTNQDLKIRQASIYTRLYGNMPLFGVYGGGIQRLYSQQQLPIDRPTMNVIQSCVDTLVSRITQSRPKPTFLTDNGDYKQRKLGKQLNSFIGGELYQTKAYDMAELLLRDAAVLGTGCVKVLESQAKKAALERVLMTELYVDPVDSMYGDPRQLYQLKLLDRNVVESMFPGKGKAITTAEQAYPDSNQDASKSVSDQIMVVEGWHLPSGPEAGDGMHIIATTSGTLFEEEYKKDCFPFAFLHYSPRILGFWGQPLAEQLMGTQMEINKLLVTISQAINLVGVPRVFVEDGSKVVKAHLNNQIGAIVTYRGTKPQYEVAPAMPAEVYAQLQRLVDYAYQQSGISALAAASKKPEGLDSGAAIREYDDLQSDRFASLNKRYDNLFVDMAKLLVDKAADIAERDGKYQTIYPNKNGTRQIDLPDIKDLMKNPFIIQCFNSSALPRDPAGRLQKVTEMIQAGMISMQEGRRLLDYPDLEQNEKLANSGEERILQVLDEIVENGKYTPPDPFMDLPLAIDLSRQYYNLYVPANLTEAKAELLRTFNTQCQALITAATAPQAPAPGGPSSPTPMATAEPLPVSPLVPQLPPQ